MDIMILAIGPQSKTENKELKTKPIGPWSLYFHFDFLSGFPDVPLYLKNYLINLYICSGVASS